MPALTKVDAKPISKYHDCHVIGTGPFDADIMLIGIAPGRDEALKTHIPFTGQAGKFLDATLKAFGVARERCFLTNLICWWEDSPTDEEIDLCWDRLQNEIRLVNPKLIVLLGTIVSDRFLGRKGKQHLWKRGHLIWKDNRWYLPTIHPAAFLHKDSKVDIADFARDIKKLKLYPDKPIHVDYTVAESAEEAEAILWSLNGFNYIDVETSYDFLDFAYPKEDLVGTPDSKMLCFSVTNERGTWVIPGRFIGKIRRGWGSRDNVTWGMHLGMFDKAQFLRLIGEDIRITEDSLLQSFTLDERGGKAEENDRAVGVHGLKGLTAEYLGFPDYDVDVLKADAKTLHEYNAYDTAGGYRLVKLFKPLQEEDNIRDIYERVFIPGANILSDIQAYGINIDRQELFQQGAKWTEIWLRLNQELIDDAYALGWPRSLGDINVGSWQQLQPLYFDICMLPPHPVFGKSTRKEVQEWLAEKGFDFARKLLEWRGVDHTLSNYIVGVEEDLKYDGKIHPQPVMHGTRSHRLAYKKPAINTIPKYGVDPELAKVRYMYVPTHPETQSLLEADMKQGELWAMAYLSQDATLLNELQTGDAHAITATAIFGVDKTHPMWKAYREIGKLFNFGTLYYRTADGYAKNPFQGRKPPMGLEDYKLTKQQAQRIIDSQLLRWPQVRDYQKAQIQEAMHTGEQVSVSGWKRRYYVPTFKMVNQSVNFGPQTLSHEYLFDSMMKVHAEFALMNAKLKSELDKLGGFHVLFEVHDALVVEYPDKYKDDAIEVVTRYMSEPKFGFGGIPCDVATGKNWYVLEKE